MLVEIFSRLWVNTLIDDNVYEADISSLAFAQITSLPHAPSFSPPPQVIAVTTDVNPTDPEQYQQGIPWWLILLAILIALLILALIILCCWRVSSFDDHSSFKLTRLAGLLQTEPSSPGEGAACRSDERRALRRHLGEICATAHVLAGKARCQGVKSSSTGLSVLHSKC